jgi:hypothetical protein
MIREELSAPACGTTGIIGTLLIPEATTRTHIRSGRNSMRAASSFRNVILERVIVASFRDLLCGR